jgi:hypothetical protein
LTHVKHFGEKAAQKQAAKIVKMHSGSTSFKLSAPKPSMIDSPRLLLAKKGTYGASVSNLQPANQSADLKKEAADKGVPVDLNDPEKKFRVSTSLDPK